MSSILLYDDARGFSIYRGPQVTSITTCPPPNSGFAVPTTGRTPEIRARVAGDPVQRFVMRRRVTHDFWAEQQFSREDFFERQRHHTHTSHTRPDDAKLKHARNGTTHHRQTAPKRITI
ncbi:Uncharacterized protein FWK35_00014920 [Aphis craccivora]|uniref:Uncharacterized protein n=1 Tax=Aphis craccivora TaxID=307492 RepID=A0A6G0Z2W0_APHCR|nr:Uncharacterized protein FWK35_00014920 [Aphis craccivora]